MSAAPGTRRPQPARSACAIRRRLPGIGSAVLLVG